MPVKEQIAFIINPNSGTLKNKSFLASLRELKTLGQSEVVVKETGYRGHAKKIAAKLVKKGVKKIVAVGGDGTVNEVASALIHSGTDLGIIPTGSGNGLARYLKIPVSPEKALDVITNHKVKKIDACKMNRRHFFCTCGVGFDAHIGLIFDQAEHRGFLGYLKAIVREFYVYIPKKYKFTIDGKRYKERAFLITFANAGQYGNNAYISPGAKIDDGLIDVCILKPFPKSKSLSLGFRLFNRSINKSKYIYVNRGKNIRMKLDKKSPIHIDGEPVKPKKELKIKIVPKSLRVMVPV